MAIITLQQMITKVAFAVHDPLHQRFTKASIRDSIASEMDWYCYDLGIIKKITEMIVFTEGLAIYKLADNCMEIIRMAMVGYNGRVIQPTTQENIDIARGLDYLNYYDPSQEAIIKTGTPSQFMKDSVEYGYIRVHPIPSVSGAATVDETLGTTLGEFGVVQGLSVDGTDVTVDGGAGRPQRYTTEGGLHIEMDTGGYGDDEAVGAPSLFCAPYGGAIYDYYKTAEVPTWATTDDDANLVKAVVETVPDFLLKDFELLVASNILRVSKKRDDKEESAFYRKEWNREKRGPKLIMNRRAAIHNSSRPM